MAGVLYFDRVMMDCATTGTGTLTLGNAITGYQSFGSVLSTNDTCDYTIFSVDGAGVPNGDWETVRGGVYTSAGTTLTRGTCAASSNSNNAVNFSAGTKRVALTRVASRKYGTRVELTALQTIANNTTTALSGWTVIRDDLGAYSGGAPTRLTAPATGWYLITCGVNWVSTSASGKEVVDLRINGTVYPASQTMYPGGEALVIGVTTIYYLTAADYVEVTVYQNSGGGLDVDKGAYSSGGNTIGQTFFAMQRFDV